MKTTRDLLKEGFATIPNSFAYREVRFHVYHALQKLETLEKRESVKKDQAAKDKLREEKKKLQSWMPPIYQNVYQVKQTLDIIDKMIDEQNKIISGANNGKTIKSEPHNDEEDGSQTLYG